MGAMDVKPKRLWLDFDKLQIVFEYKNQEPVRVNVSNESVLNDIYRADLKAHKRDK